MSPLLLLLLFLVAQWPVAKNITLLLLLPLHLSIFCSVFPELVVVAHLPLLLSLAHASFAFYFLDLCVVVQPQRLQLSPETSGILTCVPIGEVSRSRIVKWQWNTPANLPGSLMPWRDGSVLHIPRATATPMEVTCGLVDEQDLPLKSATNATATVTLAGKEKNVYQTSGFSGNVGDYMS